MADHVYKKIEIVGTSKTISSPTIAADALTFSPNGLSAIILGTSECESTSVTPSRSVT